MAEISKRKRLQRPGCRRRFISHRLARRAAGYSLMELLTVMAILGIVIAASIPAFGRLMQSTNLENAAMQFAGHLRLARSTAVATGVPQIVDWDLENYRYRLVRDDNNNATPDAGEPVTGPFPLPRRVVFESPDDEDLQFSGNSVVFGRNGSASESGELLLSNDRGHSRGVLLLAPTGQVHIQ